MKVTICLVPFTDQDRFLQILGQVKRAKGIDFEVIVVDNSDTTDLKDKLTDEIYISNKNKGRLAGATNKAIKMAKGEYFVYVCAVHTRVYSDDWLHYMVSQMDGIPEHFVLGGDLRPFGAIKHVQGGIFIGRTKWLRQNLYNEEKHSFTFMDVDLSKQVLKTKMKMWRLSQIFSGMKGWSHRNHVQNKTIKKFKIVHAHETYNYV